MQQEHKADFWLRLLPIGHGQANLLYGLENKLGHLLGELDAKRGWQGLHIGFG